MAGPQGPVPKKTGPVWLCNTAVRLDEFARQAALAPLPPPPAAPAGSRGAEGDATRRRLLAEAGIGLNYQAVAAKSSPADLAHLSLAARNATAASFAPQRHAAWVLGRPCVVLKKKYFPRLGCYIAPEPTDGNHSEIQYSAKHKDIKKKISLSPPPGS